MSLAKLISGISRALRGGMNAQDIAGEVARSATRAAMRSPMVRAGVAGAALGDSLNAATPHFARGDVAGGCRCVADGLEAAARISEEE